MKFAYLLFLLLIPSSAFAHPGNTDSDGCHTCWTNCNDWGLSYGEYHCHKKKTLCEQVSDGNMDESKKMLDLTLKYGASAVCPVIPTFIQNNNKMIEMFQSTLSKIEPEYCGTHCIDYECAIKQAESMNQFYQDIWKLGCVSSSWSSSVSKTKSSQSNIQYSSKATIINKSISKKSSSSSSIRTKAKAKKLKKTQKCDFDTRGKCSCPKNFIPVTTECRLYE